MSSSSLKVYLKKICCFQSGQNLGSFPSPFKYYPNGLTGLYFLQSENEVKLKFKDKYYDLPQLFVFGQTLQPKELIVKGDCKIIIFFLYPDAIKRLFNLDPLSLVDDCLELSKVQLNGGNQLLDKLKSLNSTENQLILITQFLEDYIHNNTMHQKPHRVFELHSNEMLNQSLSTISKKLDISTRSMQRLFRKYVGISLSLYRRIIIFNSALEELHHNKSSSLTELALDFNYSDQAHFTRTFKEFTGITPREYIQRFHKNK
jgi:AraC-like DNA-binding protein